jgi:phosphate transport system substrate-binding protein
VPDLRAWVYDPAGEKAYPIATMTWMLFPEDMDDDKAKVAHELIEYCLTEGQKIADAMGYIPLPENVIATVREVSQKIQ